MAEQERIKNERLVNKKIENGELKDEKVKQDKEVHDAVMDDNAPTLNQLQGQQNAEQRVFTVPDFLEDIWMHTHLIAQENLEEAQQGLPGICYPGILYVHHAMLLLLVEERRHKIHRLLEELNEMEYVLGIEDM
ncbi:hypothetical protein F4604DRAFT_1931689 [Suillus subluteus]|nr:hypothetical protein F4604DRAFT_1931689 [Suillus subluteus]